MCYPQPFPVRDKGIFEFFTQYKRITSRSNKRELYWRFRHLDGTCGKEHELARMGGQYQTSFERDGRVVTMFNRHPEGQLDNRTDLYYLETRDQGKTWTKTCHATKNSRRNHTYVRKVFGAESDSPFFALWADGNTDEK